MKKALFGGMLLMAAVLTFTLSSVAAGDVCHIWPQEHANCDIRDAAVHCCVGTIWENNCPTPMDWYESSGENCCDTCLNWGADRIADHVGDSCCYLE